MSFFFGASDEARTRYLHLGKVALYQMSYTRIDKRHHITPVLICQQLFSGILKIFVWLLQAPGEKDFSQTLLALVGVEVHGDLL